MLSSSFSLKQTVLHTRQLLEILLSQAVTLLCGCSIGHIMPRARPSHMGLYRENEKCRKIKIGINVPRAQVSRVEVFSCKGQKSQGHTDHFNRHFPHKPESAASPPIFKLH